MRETADCGACEGLGRVREESESDWSILLSGKLSRLRRAPRKIFGPGRGDSRLEVWLTIIAPTPLFFVSVASKGLTISLNPLDATHTRVPGSVASKGLALHQIGAEKAASVFGDAAKSARGRPTGMAGVQSM